MTNAERIFAVMTDNDEQTVSQISAASGVNESSARKALASLVEEGKVDRHDGKPVTFSKVLHFSLEGAVKQTLGHKARSADFLRKRLARGGITATKAEVTKALLTLVARGQARQPFRTQRFAQG